MLLKAVDQQAESDLTVWESFVSQYLPILISFSNTKSNPLERCRIDRH